MLDYKLLEALAMVVYEGSFEKAAKELCITQSAISQRLKLLEETVGSILLSRTSPPRPTALGEKFLAHYRKVKILEEDLVERPGGQVDYSIRYPIAVNADSLATWVLDAISHFIIEERGLLDIFVADQEQTLRLLKEGTVLGCITSHPSSLQGCRVDKLMDFPYGWYASPEFARHWFGVVNEKVSCFDVAQVEAAPMIRYNRDDRLNQLFFAEFFGDVVRQSPTHFIPSSEKYVDAVRLGLGHGIIPVAQAENYRVQGELIDLAPSMKFPVTLYYHSWNIKSGLLQKFNSELLEKGRSIIHKLVARIDDSSRLERQV